MLFIIGNQASYVQKLSNEDWIRIRGDLAKLVPVGG